MALLLGLLSACVQVGPRQDLPTNSDQSDAQRRARVRLELASAYFGRAQFRTALDEVKQALAADPNLGEAYNLRGLIYAGMEEPQLAEESFRQALRLNARDADALHNLGWFYCQQKRFAEADQQFQAAIALPSYKDPTRTWLAQGICQARGDRLDLAERSLSRAYELDPGNPFTAVNLSEVLYRRAEHERARFYIRRVNQRDDLLSAQTLWLAIRIEHKLGQSAQVQSLGAQLRQRFPESPEAKLYEKGLLDEQ